VTSPANIQSQKIAVRARLIDGLRAELQARSWSTTWALTGSQPGDAPKPTEALSGALATRMISGIQREREAARLRIDAAQVTAEVTRIAGDGGPSLPEFRLSIEVVSPEPEASRRPILDALASDGTVTNALPLGRPIAVTYRVVGPPAGGGAPARAGPPAGGRRG